MWTLVVVNSLQDRIRDFSPSGAVVIDDQSGVPLWSGEKKSFHVSPPAR